MSQENLTIVKANDFATTAAEHIAELVGINLVRNGRCSLMLAGGRTPLAVYRILAEKYAGRVAWDLVDFYFGDERRVPPEDEQSNYFMAHEALLGPLGISSRHTFRMFAENAEPSMAAIDYAAVIPETIDVLLLGIGEDGHIASLFPGQDAVMHNEATILPILGPKPPPERLTISPGVIHSARAIIVMAAGQGKKAAVADALTSDKEPIDCPAVLVRHADWIVDEDAAAGVTG